MYRRQIELIGQKNQEILSKKDVLVVGCGGLGNIIATTISCVGLRKIYLIDFDDIEIHNIHRQFQFCESDVGFSKAEVLAKRINRCKDTEIVAIKDKFNSEIDLRVDLIFDATDNFEVRREIDKFAKNLNIAWVYASVEEFRGQVGLFKSASFEVFATKDYEVKGQFPPMVNLIGSIASMVGLKALIGEEKERLYYIDFSDALVVKSFSLT